MICCTSDVNPPSRLRGNDESRKTCEGAPIFILVGERKIMNHFVVNASLSRWTNAAAGDQPARNVAL